MARDSINARYAMEEKRNRQKSKTTSSTTGIGAKVANTSSIKKKVSKTATGGITKLPYKGGSGTLEKLPYKGGDATVTKLNQATGTGYTKTATNRATGKKTTTSGTLTPTTKSNFVGGSVSGAGKMMKKSKPLTKKTPTSRAKSVTSNINKKYALDEKRKFG